MFIKKKLVLNAVDIDHILDIGRFNERSNLPPHITLVEMLVEGAGLSGIDLNEIDVIEIYLNNL